ncbi:ABC transporter substrate-binding protein [Brachybacterium saurashtrense]|uniref:ABC transporter substrate-binding protein n=1 Tax=Brachybacterium saurashtrense TaxID=556288 RepID=A0A345YS82_9MICO|nr:ABC transporter substrate-binding protein [Brachybacterium saurashtrense]AXK46784.1 ABC transporter substrate-binding protein [Brachybacterium saurashtrense]RRR22499.1 ABC transporter substrate-binding protein [Brachybacterium saurashtrense]
MSRPVARRSLLAGGLSLPLLGLGLSSCSSGPGAEEGPATPFPTAWDDQATIDVFDGLANQMGEQPGWFGHLVADEFALTLNVIAPNVAGGGDTLYNTRVAAGELGDLVLTDVGQKLDELIEGGLLMDVSSLYANMDSASRFDDAVQKVNEGKDGIYAIPTQVSSLKPTEPSEGIDPTFGPFVRWDLYKEVGYPEIGTLEDLLPVLKEMQDVAPEADNGGRVYALSLFNDWDGNYMNNAKQPCCYYGYDEVGFVLAKADGSDYQSILDSDSLYVRVLQWFFDANQMGLVDPDSTTQNYDSLFSKMQGGQVLFSFWPWQGQAAYNSEANMAEGKGFMIAPLADQKIFSYGAPAFGARQVFGVGSTAEDPERVAAFLDWLYSPAGVYSNSSQTMGAAGPQGLTWELNDDGKPELTDFGRDALLGDGATVPEEWGGGSYTDGASWLNVTTVLGNDEDPETGHPFNYKMWETYQQSVSNPLTEDWAGVMGGYATTMEYLNDNDMVLVAPGASYVAPQESSEVETIRNQVKAVIVENSWKMAFASDQATFDALLKDMQETAEGLGYQTVLDVDMANAEEQNALRESVAAEFG